MLPEWLNNPHPKGNVWAELIFFCNVLPASLSVLVQDVRFEDAVMDIFYCSGWVTFFQVIIGFVLVPLKMIPGFGRNSGHDLLQF